MVGGLAVLGGEGVAIAGSGGAALVAAPAAVTGGAALTAHGAGVSLVGAINLAMQKGRKVEHSSLETHHLLPKSKKLRPFFERAGLNIEDYTTQMKAGAHRIKPGGLHTGKRNWNARWEEFFKKNPNAGKDEILEYLENLRNEFGI
jgi:hypothetical protein